METGLLKKYIKDDYKILGGLFVGACIFQIIMSYIASRGVGFGLSIMDLGTSIFWVYNLLFFFSIFGFLPTIFAPMLNKEQADVWNTMPMKRDKYFNTLIMRFVLDVILPIVVLGFILLLIPQEAYNEHLFGAERLTTFDVINNISSTMLTGIGIIFFIVISGNIGNVICNYIAFMSLLGFITFFFTDAGIATLGGVTENSKYLSVVVQFATAFVLFFVDRYLYKIRQVENIGKMFVFKHLDVAFSTLYSSVFAAWLTIIIWGYNGVGGFLVGLIVLILAYSILLSLFTLDIKIIKTKYKTLKYPIIMFTILVIIGSFADSSTLPVISIGV